MHPAKRVLIFLAPVFMLAAAYWQIGSTLTSVSNRPIPKPAHLALQDVDLSVAGSPATKGWFMRGSSPAAVLLLHGIRGDRRQMLGRARFLHARGYSVMLIDLPGQGASPAKFVTFGLAESRGVAAALRYLRGELPGQPIGVIGASLGAASLVLCTSCPQVDAVVLEAMYPTIEEAVEDRLRMRLGALGVPLAQMLLWQLSLRLDIHPDQLRPIDRLDALGAPVLIAAGSADQHTRVAETRRLFARAAEPKQLWVVDGAGHQDLHRFAGAQYEERIGAFMAQHLTRR